MRFMWRSSKHKSDSTLKCQKILEIDEEKINIDSSVPSTERKRTQLAKYPLPIPEEPPAEKIVLSIPKETESNQKKIRSLNRNEISIGKSKNANFLNPTKNYSYRKDLKSIVQNPKVLASSHPGYKNNLSVDSERNFGSNSKHSLHNKNSNSKSNSMSKSKKSK